MYHVLTFLVILLPYIFSTLAIAFAIKGSTVGFFIMLFLTLASIPFVTGWIETYNRIERGKHE